MVCASESDRRKGFGSGVSDEEFSDQMIHREFRVHPLGFGYNRIHLRLIQGDGTEAHGAVWRHLPRVVCRFIRHFQTVGSLFARSAWRISIVPEWSLRHQKGTNAILKTCNYLNSYTKEWWRRGELNPRPQALYRQIYILSQVVRFDRLPANRQADKRRVTYFLAFRKVTLRRASSCK